MTVCIAALYGNGAGCILVSDKMTTARIPLMYEFENEEVEKIAKIADNIYVMISGDVLFANEVKNNAKQHIANKINPEPNGISHTLMNSYQAVRRTRVIRNELEPRGLDINKYYEIQQKILGPIVQMIDNAFRLFNPNLDLIIAGKDETTCHICTIGSPGDMVCHDPIGFVSIGSGGPHAMYSLIDSGYKKSLDKETVKKFVEAAKKRSEVAPGVGKETKIIEL